MKLMYQIMSRYRAYLTIGLGVVVVGFLLGIVRLFNQGALSTAIFSGETTSPSYQQALIVERVLEHTIEQWLIWGLAFLKLGIGMAVATIAMNLLATGQQALQTFSQNGVAVPRMPKPPFFARAFPLLLVLGWILVTVAMLATVWWDANVITLSQLEFAGQTDTPAYQTVLITERTLEHFIKPGKFVGTALMVLGIAWGLATIIINLSLQSDALPQLSNQALRRVLHKDSITPREPRPKVVWGLNLLAFAGALITISATIPLVLLRNQNDLLALSEEFMGRGGSPLFQATHTTQVVLDQVIDVWIFVGLATVLFSISLLLLTIIRLLRQQRKNLIDLVCGACGFQVSGIEKPLWPTRLTPWFAAAGLLIVLFFLVPYTLFWRVPNTINLLATGFAGGETTGLLGNELVFEQFMKPAKFMGIGSLMLGIGLALVTIVINLRLTALLIPTSFSKLFAAARGEEADASGLVATTDPLGLAPWRLFAALALGVLIVFSATVPLALLRIDNTLTYLAAGSVTSSAYQTAWHNERLLEHFILPFKLLGVGIIFFTIGRFFGSIVGFVKARRQLIVEGVSSLCYLCTLPPSPQPVEAVLAIEPHDR